MKKENLNEILAEISSKFNFDDSALDWVKERKAEWEKFIDDSYEKKYEDMKKRYYDRFFTSENEMVEDQIDNIKEDDESTEITVDDLFSRKESDYKEKK